MVGVRADPFSRSKLGVVCLLRRGAGPALFPVGRGVGRTRVPKRRLLVVTQTGHDDPRFHSRDGHVSRHDPSGGTSRSCFSVGAPRMPLTDRPRQAFVVEMVGREELMNAIRAELRDV